MDGDCITFRIDHAPVGQPRARATSIGGMARMYTPTRRANGSKHPIVTFRTATQAAWQMAVNRRLLTGPVAVTILAWFPRPKAEIRKRSPMPAYRHVKKPDVDNVAKSVLDALTGLAWADDDAVWCLRVEKWTCGGTDTPCVLVRIAAADGEPPRG